MTTIKHDDASSAPVERDVMTHIEKMQATLHEIGIPTTKRKRGDYEYLFIGNPADASCLLGMEDNYETTDLDLLLRRHKFFEFENGELASWPAL